MKAKFFVVGFSIFIVLIIFLIILIILIRNNQTFPKTYFGNNCEIFVPMDGKMHKCGYIRSSDDSSIDYYLGKLSSVKKEYYLNIDVGLPWLMKVLVYNASLNVYDKNNYLKNYTETNLLEFQNSVLGNYLVIQLPAGEKYLHRLNNLLKIYSDQPDKISEIDKQKSDLVECNQAYKNLRVSTIFSSIGKCKIRTNNAIII